MRWSCLLLVFLAAVPAHAQDKPTVLLMDESVSTVSGARERLGFERFPIGEEDPTWHGGPGKTGKTILGTAGAVAFGGLGAAIGVGVMDGLAQERRNDTIQALRTAVEQDKRLYGVFLAAVNKEATRQGMKINDTFLSQRTEVGVVAKFGKAGGAALSLAGDDVPMVTLSWDDRFPLMALDVRRFRMSRTGTGLLPREEAARIVRYVGHPAPANDDAVAFWAADGAKGFLAEIGTGLAALLPVALSEDIDVPSVKRKERVILTIGEQQLEFPGRLWKQEGGLAYLFNSDEGITVVRVQPVADATVGAANRGVRDPGSFPSGTD